MLQVCVLRLSLHTPMLEQFESLQYSPFMHERFGHAREVFMIRSNVQNKSFASNVFALFRFVCLIYKLCRLVDQNYVWFCGFLLLGINIFYQVFVICLYCFAGLGFRDQNLACYFDVMSHL